MATYYEIGISIEKQPSIVTLDSNATPVKDWKDAVDHVMRLAKLFYPTFTTEFDFVKEYEIEDEPSNLGYIHQPQDATSYDKENLI
jgi:hypothetical protein|tara:strand:- start:411 stop:668 length:258 start_codon:yes stop_codon:yes gene_type:complete